MYGLGYECMKVKCKNCDKQQECDMWDRLTYRPFEKIMEELYDTENSELCVVRKGRKE